MAGELLEKAFEDYMFNGGGMVTAHAGNNCWPKWKEYNKMTAGGWGGRNEKIGPYLYINDKGEVIRDTSKVERGGAHGLQHEVELIVRDTEHPIMKGLPPVHMVQTSL